MILTTLHRRKNAIRFKRDEQDDTWIVLGRTAAWTNEAAPPNPSISDTSIDTPICAYRATVHWVKEDDDNGTLLFRDSQGNLKKFLEFLTETDALTNNCQQILVKAEVLGSDLENLSVTAFRQVAIFTNLVPDTGHENDDFLAAADITSYGQMETIHNRKPLSLEAESSWIASAILEF